MAFIPFEYLATKFQLLFHSYPIAPGVYEFAESRERNAILK